MVEVTGLFRNYMLKLEFHLLKPEILVGPCKYCLSLQGGSEKKKKKKSLGNIKPSYCYCLLARSFYHPSYIMVIETAALGFGTFEGVKTSAWEREKAGESEGSRQLPEVDLGLIDEI